VLENQNSLSTAGLRLESLEDRTTPAVVSPAVNPFAVDASALGGVTLGQAANIDRAFLSEVARVSAMEWFLGTTAASQGANAQIRSFGQQLAASELNLLNQVVPALTRSGGTIQLTPVDLQLINTLSTLPAGAIDNQFLFFSNLYGLQSAGLARTEAQLGTNATVRTFAQSQFTPVLNQLQTGFGFIDPNLAATTVNLFPSLDRSGVFSTSLNTGLNGTGFAGVAPTSFGTTSSATTGFGTSGFGTTAVGTSGFGTTAVGTTTFGSSGFGPGASFGTNSGFGPANTMTSFDSGFGPANTTNGFNSTSATPGSVGMSGTGSAIF